MTRDTPDQDILAKITPTPARRIVSFTIILGFGAMLVYMTLSSPPQSLFWRSFLLVLGIGSLVLAEKLRRATLLSIHMTSTELSDSSGRKLCDIADITGIDRGSFAFKPSNGFLIRTKNRQPRAWRPGLWWRLGRRIGVGGATPAGESKFMAELIAQKIESAAKDLGGLGGAGH